MINTEASSDQQMHDTPQLSHFQEKVRRLSGLKEVSQVNDLVFFSESDQNGGVMIEVFSDNAMEEDLSLISDEGIYVRDDEEIANEPILSPKETRVLMTQAFADTIARLAPFTHPSRLQYLFPGLDPAEIEKSDVHQEDQGRWNKKHLRPSCLGHSHHLPSTTRDSLPLLLCFRTSLLYYRL